MAVEARSRRLSQSRRDAELERWRDEVLVAPHIVYSLCSNRGAQPAASLLSSRALHGQSILGTPRSYFPPHTFENSQTQPPGSPPYSTISDNPYSRGIMIPCSPLAASPNSRAIRAPPLGVSSIRSASALPPPHHQTTSRNRPDAVRAAAIATRVRNRSRDGIRVGHCVDHGHLPRLKLCHGILLSPGKVLRGTRTGRVYHREG